MTNADKAKKMEYALRQLGAEYAGRPDVVHAIREFLTDVGPAQLALLHDLVTRHYKPSALDELLPHYDPNVAR
jgi:hypothetical protein